MTNAATQERAINTLVCIRMLQSEIAAAIQRGNWAQARTLTCSLVRMAADMHKRMPAR